MKVAHVESGRHLYGGARQVAYLIDGLNALGVESVLLCRPASAIGQHVADCRVLELPMHGDLDFGLIGRLRRAIRQEKPDVLHVHSRSGADYFGGVAAHRESCPAVLTRRVDRPEPRLLAAAKYRRYDAIAAISRAVRAHLVDAVGDRAPRVECIPSAVDATRFAPNLLRRQSARHAWGLGNDEFVIGAVGQLIARKGYDVLLEAMPIILSRFDNLRLMIFGQGPLRQDLQRRICRLGLESRVRLLGYEPDMEKQLPGLDLFVHSARAEGLGLAVLEALSTGLPVIARRVGGLPDLIADGLNGVLIEDAPDALAAAVIGLIQDDDRRERLGARARACVLERFTIRTMSEGYLRVYESLSMALRDDR